MTKTSKSQGRSDSRFRDVQTGDKVRLRGLNFRVVDMERENKLVHLRLQGADGEISTLIGVPKAPLPVGQGRSEIMGAVPGE
ncbi:hypothetical protein [Arthrobacter sp. M4]|uniref:hypothetical protein n=1 Tax=Arthrobacter sp. M4 TaxID=218160 RepID=UPI001CDBA8BE|nr:hypothetical protein [Arthrobacter sp. M4]MCA4133343.1 hypothetical protein [Arthrobacter sp. M4]